MKFETDTGKDKLTNMKAVYETVYYTYGGFPVL